MSRTTPALVQGILLKDYDTDGAPDLQPFIDAASSIVSNVVSDALSKKGITIADTGVGSQAEIIERWLSAHMYCQNDPQYQNNSTAGASAGYTGQTGMGLQNTRYGLTAMRIDWSGVLRNMDQQQRGSGAWLGKTLPEQQSYDERN